MKLLFDQNFSSDLVRRLSDLFHGSTHVKDLDMMRSDDTLILELRAREWVRDRFQGFRFPATESGLGRSTKGCVAARRKLSDNSS